MRTGGCSPRHPDLSDIPPSTTCPTRKNRTPRATPPNSRCHASPAHLPRGARRARPLRPDQPSRESTQRARPTRGTRQSHTAHTLMESPHTPQTDKPAHWLYHPAPRPTSPCRPPDPTRRTSGPPGAHPAMPHPPDTRQQHFRPSTPLGAWCDRPDLPVRTSPVPHVPSDQLSPLGSAQHSPTLRPDPIVPNACPTRPLRPNLTDTHESL